MHLRALCAAIMALLLGGCAAWVAETRLIPASERDSPGLIGLYVGNETGAVLIAQGDQGFMRVADPAVEQPPVDVAFDMLREERPERSLFAPELIEDEGAAPPEPDRSFLMEIPMEGDTGKVAFAYGILRVKGGQPAGSFTQYTVLCSTAAEALAARKEDQACVFDDYARLRAAALDALAWYDDARMELETNTFTLQSEADAMDYDAIEDAGP